MENLASTTSMMMNGETGIFLVFMGFLILFTICWLLSVFWPMDHTDIRYKPAKYK